MRGIAFVLLVAVAAGGPKPGTLTTTIPVRGIAAGGAFAFGGSAVDATTGRYFLADRTNAALDVFDTKKLTQIAQVKDRFAAPGAVVVAGGSVYVGDVDKLHVVNAATLTPARPVAITSSGGSTDRGCFDPDDGLLMVTNPLDSPPFVTWLSTKTNAVTTRLLFTGSASAPTAVNFGGCVYDPGTRSFYLNNSGSTPHPRGELDVITAKSVRAKAPVVSAAFDLQGCGPRGVVRGAQGMLFIACEPAAGEPGRVLFVSTSGKGLRTLATTGGGETVAFDPKLDRFYCACFDWTATGITGAGTVTPVLGIVDGTTRKLIANAPTRQDATSVAVDPETRHVFVPIAPSSSDNGGIRVYAP